MFLDPAKPIATCAQSSCTGCPLSDSIHCHFQCKYLARFLAVVLPAFIVAIIGVYWISVWYLIPWVIFFVAYFGLIEIRVMCSHCPHYAEPGESLKCWANYGSPKLWRYRPGPMSLIEKVVFWAGLAGVFLYPLLLFLVYADWTLAVVYTMLMAVAYLLMMRKSMCSQCMNFACPLNLVDQETREEFFERNPEVRIAWKGS